MSNLEMSILVSRKAAQGFALRRSYSTPQPESRGKRRVAQKKPFLDKI